VIILNKKTIYIVVAVIVVILIVGIASVMLLNNNGNGGTPTSTPTPAPSATVVGANTVQFSVTETTTSTGDKVAYTFAAKNFNTSTEVIRVDLSASGTNVSYVLNAGQQKSYLSTDNGAKWAASTFNSDWTSYGTLFNSFINKLAAAGNTADMTYTTDTGSITISCVTVNSAIADSVFSTGS
jgi:hypothetical protein